MMYHATHRDNLGSIRMRGLLKHKAQGKRKAVYIHDADARVWAIHHVAARHGWDVSDVILIEVDERTLPIRLLGVPGAYYVCEDVSPRLLSNAHAVMVDLGRPCGDGERIHCYRGQGKGGRTPHD